MVSWKPQELSSDASILPLGARLQEAAPHSTRLAGARPRLGPPGSGALPSLTRGASAEERRRPHVRLLRAHLRRPPSAPPSAPPRRGSLVAAARGGAGAAPGLISDAVSWLSLVVPDPERSWGCGPHSGHGGRRRRRQWGRALCPAAHPVSPLRRERRWRSQTHHRPPPPWEPTGGGPPAVVPCGLPGCGRRV